MTASQTCISDLSSMSHSFLAVDSCRTDRKKSVISQSIDHFYSGSKAHKKYAYV